MYSIYMFFIYCVVSLKTYPLFLSYLHFEFRSWFHFTIQTVIMSIFVLWITFKYNDTRYSQNGERKMPNRWHHHKHTKRQMNCSHVNHVRYGRSVQVYFYNSLVMYDNATAVEMQCIRSSVSFIHSHNNCGVGIPAPFNLIIAQTTYGTYDTMGILLLLTSTCHYFLWWRYHLMHPI